MLTVTQRALTYEGHCPACISSDMASIRGYIAASVDGYIADRDGGVGWLEPFEAVDFGYERFIGEINTVVMGRNTYEQARGFGPDWVYLGKRGIVVTSKPITNPPPDVAAWTEGIPKLVPHLRKLDDGDVWIVGGSRLQSALLDLAAIDRLELFLIPILLGDGVPLFLKSEHSATLCLDAIEQFEMGLVRLDYRLRRAD